MPTPSATRKTDGPRMCIDGGAGGNGRIGIGSSRPACQTRSVDAVWTGSSGTSEVLLVTSKAVSLFRRQRYREYRYPPTVTSRQKHHRSLDWNFRAAVQEPSGPALRAHRYFAPRTATGVS